MTRVLREIKDEKGHVIQTQEEEEGVSDVQPKPKPIQKPVVMDVSSPQQHPPSPKPTSTSTPSPASTPSSSVKITDDVASSDKVSTVVKKKPGVSTSRND